MGVANLFHRLEGREATQSQQHTGFGILKIVSTHEIVFYQQTKSETRNSLCHGPDDKKGRVFQRARATVKVLL